jgi:hypothetical protein
MKSFALLTVDLDECLAWFVATTAETYWWVHAGKGQQLWQFCGQNTLM